MAKEQHKTNAMRTLDATGARYEARFFDCPEALSGVEVARRLGIDEDRVFKTLVTEGRSVTSVLNTRSSSIPSRRATSTPENASGQSKNRAS